MLDWNKIETVFFDMDGTLLDLHFDNYFWLQHLPKRYAEIKNASPAETKERLHSLYLAHQGSLNWYCLDFWSKELGINVAILKHEIKNLIAYRPDARKFLQWLHQQEKDIAIVTNAHWDSVELKIAETDLSVFFNEIICSHDFSFEKESSFFWTSLQEKRAFNPATTVFFDDNETVLSAAKEFGIRYLFSIRQPDSQKPPRIENEFTMVHSFLDLLPKAAAGKRNRHIR